MDHPIFGKYHDLINLIKAEFSTAGWRVILLVKCF